MPHLQVKMNNFSVTLDALWLCTYPNSTTWPIFQQWYHINATYRVTAMYIATKYGQIQKLKYTCM